VGAEARTARASAAEWREWERLAASAGLKRNTWLRRTINDGAAPERTLEAMDAREREGQER
jgi:hypothetical protein